MIVFALLGGCTVVDSDPGSLRSGATPSPVPSPAPTPDRVWVDVDSYPCGHDADGFVQCWSGSDALNAIYAVPTNPTPVVAFDVRIQAAQGLRADGTAFNWYCQDGWDELECSVPTQRSFQAISSTVGLLDDGYVTSWDNVFGVDHVFEELGPQRLFSRAFFTGAAVMNSGNLARIVSQDRIVDGMQFPTDRTYEQIAQFGEGACALADDGTIDCLGAEPTVMTSIFDNPPYLELKGSEWATCARRRDDRIDCHNGETFDFGPIRAYSVQGDGHYVQTQILGDDGWREPTVEGPIAICVVTESNAIECIGDRYPQEVLDALPRGE